MAAACPPLYPTKLPLYWPIPQKARLSRKSLLRWALGGIEGRANGGHQRTPSTIMIKVGCVFYYQNPVS